MARSENTMFIGHELITIEGRSVKHPSLVKTIGNVNVNKITKDKPKFIGIDLETNHLTGELKLLGFYEEGQYTYYQQHFISILFNKCKDAFYNKKKLVWWNKLDPFIIFKTFVQMMPDEKQQLALMSYNKISGENKKDVWTIPPIAEVNISNYVFGIKNVIRSSVQFFFYHKDKPETVNKVWAFDVACLYNNKLEEEAKRFDYYSKIDESAHKIDWGRFETDKDFRENVVLKSNYYDARAVHDLADKSVEDFHKIFDYYPRTLISAGSLARAGIVATITNIHGESRKDKIMDDLKSININTYYDGWAEQLGEYMFKELISIFNEAYSGGYIETIAYGFVEKAYTADIASAYPSIAVNLLDLRDNKVTHGKGTPPRVKNSYCFIRGDIVIPEEVDYHPITIKHPVLKDTNIRASGNYRCAYTINERDYLISLGATFSNEEWFNVETTGELSPLAVATRHFLDARTKLQAKGDSAEYTAKTCSNSIYGITYEAVPTYFIDEKEIVIDEFNDTFEKDILSSYRKRFNLTSIKDDLKITLDTEFQKVWSMWHNDTGIEIDSIYDELIMQGINLQSNHPVDMLLEINHLYRQEKQAKETSIEDFITRDGYRSGEFKNDLYAAIITSEVRLLLSKAGNAIKDAGGQPLLFMTDSVFWSGSADMLPKELWREKKTLGYFEKPLEIKNFTCLGAGRYDYYMQDGYYQSKRRGLNIVDLLDSEGIKLSEFKWYDIIKLAVKQKSSIVNVNVRLLISVGLILNQRKYRLSDLGRIIDDTRDVELIVGYTKRVIPKFDLDQLLNSLIITKPLLLDYKDYTLPILREHLHAKKYITLKQKEKSQSKKTSRSYYKKNRDKIRHETQEKYQLLTSKGFSPDAARKHSKKSLKNIKKLLNNC